MELTIPTTEQVSNTLERTARLVAPAVALAITCALLLVQLAYDLGFMLGTAVHQRNAQLDRKSTRLNSSHRT